MSLVLPLFPHISSVLSSLCPPLLIPPLPPFPLIAGVSHCYALLMGVIRFALTISFFDLHTSWQTLIA